MSNALAIAAVTRTMRKLLDDAVKAPLPGNLPPDVKPTTEIQVTILPLDRARDGDNTKNQINLFLYQSVLNAAWRNTDIPRRVMPGETGYPPLALNLYYLITAYGQDNNELISQFLLGRAVSVLHDHPVLGPTEISEALGASELQNQIERIRVTPQPLSLEEISKLWAGLQTNYRLSAAYEAAVVLIDSTRPSRTPLPVLTRGPADQGVAAQADLIPPYPAIDDATPPNHQISARLGDVLTITGHHLDGAAAVVRFTTSRLLAPFEIAPQAGGSAEQMTVQLPNDPVNWPAGFYTVAVAFGPPANVRTTNELSLSLAPSITTALPVTVARVGGNATLNLNCSPQVRPEQRAALLVGDREIVAEPHTAQTDRLTFITKAANLGTFFLRLRVDGVDSLLIDRTVTPPVFDQTQKVKIT